MASHSLEEVAQACGGAKALSDGSYSALCPAHDDHNASLNLKETSEGRILDHCFAGCSHEEVTTAIAARLSEFNPNPAKERKLARREKAAKVLPPF
jgi:hypothetical protein